MAKVRIRTHSYPGDVARSIKIDMWEGRGGRPGAKGWKRMHLARERAVLKRRQRWPRSGLG